MGWMGPLPDQRQRSGLQRSADAYLDHQQQRIYGQRCVSRVSGDLERGGGRVTSTYPGKPDLDAAMGNKRPESERTARGIRSRFRWEDVHPGKTLANARSRFGDRLPAA